MVRAFLSATQSRGTGHDEEAGLTLVPAVAGTELLFDAAIEKRQRLRQAWE
jgi:hypothetical protein